MDSNHIRVSKETYKRLNSMKDQGETFDDVVSRSLDEREQLAKNIELLKQDIANQ